MQRFPSWQWLRQHWLDLSLIAIIVLATLAVRGPIAMERKIMPAGDAFNLHSIAVQMRHFDYPTREKRLPVHPLFLIPGQLLGLPLIPTSVVISMAAGAGIMVSLYVLGRLLKLHRAATLAVVSLAIFDPLLVSNAIRPLNDSLFLLWVMVSLILVTTLLQRSMQPPQRLLWITGTVLTLMMFTRYEGFLLAGLLIPLLWFRRPWQEVLMVAMVPILATLAWLPVYVHIHGSLGGLSYVTDATSPDGGFGEVSLIPDNISRMLSTSWRRAWEVPATEPTEFLVSSGWWISLLGVIGVPWLLIRNGRAGLPVTLVAIGYTLLLAWWWVYSRYVAPLETIFYLAAAAGISAIMTFIELVGDRRHSRPLAPSLMVLLAVGLGWILYTEGTALHKTAVARAWENNRKGYALYQAFNWAHHQNAPTVYLTDEHLVATLFLGLYNEPKDATNPGLGVYLSRYRDEPPESIINDWREKRIAYIIEAPEDSRLSEIIRQLSQARQLETAHTFKQVRWDDGELESVRVLKVTW